EPFLDYFASSLSIPTSVHSRSPSLPYCPIPSPPPSPSPHCQEFIEGFLFAGSHELGTKGFLDYFPDYRQEDGSIAKKRSMKGKAYSSRPWDAHGRLIL
ncbi:unnamed protein product, partial [Closterium sp. Naga37s-1]